MLTRYIKCQKNKLQKDSAKKVKEKDLEWVAKAGVLKLERMMFKQVMQ